MATKKKLVKKAAAKKAVKKPVKKAAAKKPVKKAAVKKPVKKAAALSALPSDGSLEVCQAIAAVSGLVSVDVSVVPFKVTPKRLFLLAFNAANVGINDLQMAVFKERLKEFLPSIPDTIDGIAEDSTQLVGDVHQIVLLGLQS